MNKVDKIKALEAVLEELKNEVEEEIAKDPKPKKPVNTRFVTGWCMDVEGKDNYISRVGEEFGDAFKAFNGYHRLEGFSLRNGESPVTPDLLPNAPKDPVKGEVVLCRGRDKGDYSICVADGKGRTIVNTNGVAWEEIVPTGQVIDLDAVLAKAKGE